MKEPKKTRVKPERVADSPEGHAAKHRDLDTVEKLTDDGNLTKFNQRKCRVLQLGRRNPEHHHMLRDTQIESSSAGKDLEFWWLPS